MDESSTSGSDLDDLDLSAEQEIRTRHVLESTELGIDADSFDGDMGDGQKEGGWGEGGVVVGEENLGSGVGEMSNG